MNLLRYVGKDFWVRVKVDNYSDDDMLNQYFIRILDYSDGKYQYNIVPAVVLDGNFNGSIDIVNPGKVYTAELDLTVVTPVEGYTTDELIPMLSDSDILVRRKVGY